MPYIIIAVSLFVVDSIIKMYIEKNKELDKIELKLHGKVAIKRFHNRGAILSIGEKKQHFIALLSLVCTILVTGIFVVILKKKGQHALKTGLALILGGAYSNTYDRMKRKYVVDYLSFPIETHNTLIGKLLKKFGTIVFNISDFGIIIGSILLVANKQNGKI